MLYGATTVTLSDFQSVLDALTAQFSVTTIVAVLAGVLAIGVAFVFMWWGVRKGLRMLMSAIRKGKVSA